MCARVPQAMAQFALKIEKLDKLDTRNGAGLRSPSPIMAPAMTQHTHVKHEPILFDKDDFRIFKKKKNSRTRFQCITKQKRPVDEKVDTRISFQVRGEVEFSVLLIYDEF